MLMQLEQRVLAKIGTRFSYMLNKPHVNPDTLLALFTLVLKQSEISAYEPTVRLNLPRDEEGDYHFSMYGPDKRLVSPEARECG